MLLVVILLHRNVNLDSAVGGKKLLFKLLGGLLALNLNLFLRKLVLL